MKYEWDPASGLFRVSRVFKGSMVYPVNYGFIPGTLAPDGDCLDIMTLDCPPLLTGSLLALDVVGGLHILDRGDEDFKLFGRPAYLERTKEEPPDPEYLAIIVQFFRHYKEQEGTSVEVRGMVDRFQAVEVVREAQARYAGFRETRPET